MKNKIPLKTQAQRLADVNLLYIQKRITEGERLRRIFAICEEYENKVEVILTNKK